MLQTVDQVIHTLGGTGKTAALLKATSPAVSNWKKRGRIPAEFFFVISAALTRKGKSAAPSLFGFVEAAE